MTITDGAILFLSLSPSANHNRGGRAIEFLQEGCFLGRTGLFRASATAVTFTTSILERKKHGKLGQAEGRKLGSFSGLIFSSVLFLKIHFAKMYGLQVSEKGSSKETPSGVNEKNYINHSKFSMKLHCQAQREKMLFPSCISHVQRSIFLSSQSVYIWRDTVAYRFYPSHRMEASGIYYLTFLRALGFYRSSSLFYTCVFTF